MMTLEQVQNALTDRRLPVVAKETGLSYFTVRRVAKGEDQRVTYETIKRLSDYLTKD